MIKRVVAVVTLAVAAVAASPLAALADTSWG